MKVVPSLIEGPMAVKMVTPSRGEYPIHTNFVPVNWRTYEPTQYDKASGRALCPAIECEVDCIKSRIIRSMATISKKHCTKVIIDMAAVIHNEANESEPAACLGLWRLSRIDVDSCPAFPDRFALIDTDAEDGYDDNMALKQSQCDPDVLRASAIMGITPEHLKELQAAEAARQ
jgi:Protein ENHANCED DISEASE RESISTANCE 2, C-terminal